MLAGVFLLQRDGHGLDLSDLLGEHRRVDRGGVVGIPCASQHLSQLAPLEHVKRPAKRVRHRGGVKVEPLVLRPRAVVIVGCNLKAVER